MNLSSYDSLATFLFIYGGNESNQRGQNGFKHLAETISREVDEVLNSFMEMVKDFI